MKNNLDLENFFPYQFSILAQQMSEYIAQIYRHEYGLSRFEWRALAAIAQKEHITAKGIMQITRLDKMQVSRAITKLTDSGYLAQQANPDDRRSTTLSLSESGQIIYQEIVPKVLEQEKALLDNLTPEQRKCFKEATKVLSMKLDSN